MNEILCQQFGYWEGPYNIRVPNSINRIRASDGGNRLYKNGAETEMFVPNPLTKEEIFKSILYIIWWNILLEINYLFII